ncbi:MAG: 16S rRNA (cytosine(1402)-N(4))-methyltransferase RsmH [Anaerolineales bacterium]|jgi:16S rRNA (cytosine1402-N4)-methyltransferase
MGTLWDQPEPESHVPVLYHQVLSALKPHAGGRHIDGTLGLGGHAKGILKESSPDGQLLGLDCDPLSLERAGELLRPFGDRVHLRHGSFAQMRDFTAEVHWPVVDAILLDLGVSSVQLDDPQRGFSFRFEGPLDMRLDPTQALTAAELVNHASEKELAAILRDYGEEPRARQVAREIVAARPLGTTLELAEIVRKNAARKRRGFDPCTRTFQALRIAVNDELGSLEVGLEQAIELLAPGGRLVVISFHSLEDRIVKRTLARESKDCICPPEQPICTCDHRARLRLLTRRPLRPDRAELQRNPRSHSARMRVAESLGVA